MPVNCRSVVSSSSYHNSDIRNHYFRHGWLLVLSKPKQMEHKKVQVSYAPAVLFVAILFGLPFMTSFMPFLAIFCDFFQAGSLVFGGGHVVLPLLQTCWVPRSNKIPFLTGYAAAQAVPGPMFTLATYLGYFLYPSAPIFGALLATLGVFFTRFSITHDGNVPLASYRTKTQGYGCTYRG